MSLVSIEQGQLATSAGKYYFPIFHVDTPSTQSVNLVVNGSALNAVRHSLSAAYGAGGTDFTMGDNVVVQTVTGNSVSIAYKYQGNTYYTGMNLTSSWKYFSMCRFAFHFSDDKIILTDTSGDTFSDAFILSKTDPTQSTLGEFTYKLEDFGFSYTAGYETNFCKVLTNFIVPQYVWTAWEQLSGNAGQYRCELSKLSDTVLVDTSVHTGDPGSIFSKISSRSSIWSIIQNATLGTEITIMWSGRNWATVTMTASGVSGNYQLTFKFYNPNMSETTPFYSYSVYIVYSPSGSGVNSDSNILLTFAYDTEQQAAVFLPAVYRASGLAEGYSWGLSSQNTPTEEQMLYLFLWLTESGAGTPEYPYDTGTTDDGGNPGGPQPGDHMPRPSVPTLSGLNAKLVTLYAPTDEQLEDIAEYLWSNDVIANIRKFVNNFADNIIALYVLPHKPANLPTKSFTVGNMTSGDITDVAYVTARFADIDMGSVTVKTTYDSYLDFSPYTRFKIYLPGVGLMDLSADDIMCPTDPETGTLKPVDESTISVRYTLDLLTGLLVAFVFVNGEMRYQFPGKVGYNIPITGANYTSLVTGAVSAMAGLIGAAATGGLSAPITAGAISAAVSGTVNAMKPEVHRGGNLSGDVSAMGEESPYLIYYRPNKPLVENQAAFTGFPSYKTGTISSFSGYTLFLDAHIESVSCTSAERDEIMQLLKGGVII